MDTFEVVTISVLSIIAVIIGFVTTGASSLLDYFIGQFQYAIYFAFLMWWETWWALILGFAIAGGVEAWISTEAISRRLEGHGLREISLGTFFGFISSSCSYSAIATAKNIFKKGASAASSLAGFMFGSTNLVIEIGLVMYILLGWQFVLADFVGGIILILLMSWVLTYGIPDKIIEDARNHAKNDDSTSDDISCANCGMDASDSNISVEEDGDIVHFCSNGCQKDYTEDMEEKSLVDNLTSKRSWINLAKTQYKEWAMLYEDIGVGFILAGVIAAFIPKSAWLSLFTDNGLSLGVYVFWTAILGVIIGIVTFVCSVGNVPFAAVLWANGLPFGAVLAFIYADLIIPPIIDAYRKYYGKTFAAILTILIFGMSVVSGFLIHFIFLAFQIIPTHATALVIERGISFNYKAVLNILFTIFFFILLWLKKQDD